MIFYFPYLQVTDVFDKEEPDDIDKIRHRVRISVTRIDDSNGSEVTAKVVGFLDMPEEITALKTKLRTQFALKIPIADKRQEKIAGIVEVIAAWLQVQEGI